MASHIHHDDHTSTTNSSSYSTPKLSLSKLPNKPIRNNIMNNNNNHVLASSTTYATPPLHPTLTIPFQWEEAPGKPKVTKSKTARCLDLPPRLTLLLNEEGKITNTPSPTTVLDGPCNVGRCFSSIDEASLEKKEEIRSGNNKENIMMGSWRWENLKENNDNNRGVVDKGSFDFSGPLNCSTSSAYDFDTHQKKFLRFTRKGSFFNFSRNNSNLLGGIYESFKQVVPWRWRRPKNKRAI
ncbi:uncharacterized protein At4g00950 [Solanum tuberosum]|uniref:Uncharacterized protein n=2 Tax=Solanum tuberosum TaxID=4113 RepID=M1BLB6_SOLTU|nr:PREDICTED: uncharacterized protein At4g00950 [Solanum tuberosum]